MVNLKSIKRIHFIGIGGIGMSGLARLFLHEGKTVSGSDRAPSDITNALEQEGVRFFPSQAAANIESGIDLVVYTEAMAKDHPEMAAAAALGVPMMNYLETLALVANQYYLIAVSGTHGKTTTTAMLIDVLEAAGFDPSAIVGSLRTKTKSNFRAGKSKYFVVEADEYRENFRHFKPDVLVITNIDHDHVDYYPALHDVQAAFHKLAMKVPAEGAVVAEIANPNVGPVLQGLKCEVIDYKQSLDLSLPLKVPGMHNRLNAAAALAAALRLGVTPAVARAALSNFAGTWRRFEYKGEVNGAPVYDDYAHNPQKVAAAIRGARELYPDKKLILAYQPHTYSRTHALFDDFVEALSLADEVILAPIYAARETNESGVSSAQLAAAIGAKATVVADLDAATDAIRDIADTGVVVVIMGAGDITKVAANLTK